MPPCQLMRACWNLWACRNAAQETGCKKGHLFVCMNEMFKWAQFRGALLLWTRCANRLFCSHTFMTLHRFATILCPLASLPEIMPGWETVSNKGGDSFGEGEGTLHQLWKPESNSDPWREPGTAKNRWGGGETWQIPVEVQSKLPLCFCDWHRQIQWGKPVFAF